MNSVILLQDRIVKDKNEIARLDEESNLVFFIPPEEITKLDWDLINDQRYEKSRTEIGELNSIYVAINPNDPYKNDVSQYRTHFRVMDGRHKYHTSKKVERKWNHVYVLVKDFADFDLLRTHFGSGKSQQKQAIETKMIIDQLCNYYYDVEGIQRDQVALKVVKALENTRFNKMTIYRNMNPKYLSKKGRPKAIDKKLSKKDKEIVKLTNEIDSLNRQLFSVTEQKNLLEKEIEELKSKLHIKV